MKKSLFIIIGLLALISCKNKKEYDPKNSFWTYPVFTPLQLPNWPTDTSIKQEVRLYKGGYILQTVARTKYDQSASYNHYPDNYFETRILGTGYAPYNKEIVGSFDFIKLHKRS